MTCIDCKKNQAIIGSDRCHDCDIRRIAELAKQEQEAKPLRLWTYQEILDREG